MRNSKSAVALSRDIVNVVRTSDKGRQYRP
jgi:hypothetical protein